MSLCDIIAKMFMSIIFLFSGKQLQYLPTKCSVFRVDYQKKYRPGDVFFLERVLSRDLEFGQPFLPLKLKAEVLRHGRKKKIIVFKYKPKKRYKLKKGHRTKYTEIKILEVLPAEVETENK